jgi:hypothetical protein
MIVPFGELKPTMGYAALWCVLNSDFKEVFITGFTFFKTPYSKGYRDHLLDMNSNALHIKNQGVHDPELEFQEFLKLIKEKRNSQVFMDPQLKAIIES